jgi:hypothetical protein
MMPAQFVREVGCPVCGVPAGHYCYADDGSAAFKARDQHVARLGAWLKRLGFYRDTCHHCPQCGVFHDPGQPCPAVTT